VYQKFSHFTTRRTDLALELYIIFIMDVNPVLTAEFTVVTTFIVTTLAKIAIIQIPTNRAEMM